MSFNLMKFIAIRHSRFQIQVIIIVFLNNNLFKHLILSQVTIQKKLNNNSILSKIKFIYLFLEKGFILKVN